MLKPSLTGWRDQYDRLLRSRERLKHASNPVEFDDDLHHFIQDCWHLKDWIKADPVTCARSRIDAEVQRHPALMVAADLCNASKHLQRTRGDRTGAYVTSKNVTVYIAGKGKSPDIEHIVTLKDGSIVTARELVDQCMAAWENVLRALCIGP